jgi:hypothetical protein
MATSGTVATTTIDTASILDHAFRRCKVLPSAQTPETTLIAKECLYMIMLNLANRGLNLWAVDKGYMGIVAGQAKYTMPAGSLDVLNVIYTQPTLATSTFAATATGGTATITTATVVRVGFKLAAAYTGTITVASSTDNVTFTTDSTIPSTTYATGQYYWVDMVTATSAAYFRVQGTSASAVMSDVIVATSLYDLPVTIWNRDTYSALNNNTR